MCFEFENLPIEFDSEGNASLKEDAAELSTYGEPRLEETSDDDPNRLREVLVERHISMVVVHGPLPQDPSVGSGSPAELPPEQAA